MLIFEILSFALSYEHSYTGEAFATLQADSSPAKLTFTKGLGLMLVEWPEAKISISIPDVLSSPKELTQKDGYSLFTFANDNAEVVITFKSTIKYFVISCPQENSNSGAILYVSNKQSNSVSATDDEDDYYFSVFGDYSLSGQIDISGLWGGTLKYNDGEGKKELKELESIDLSPIRFTSKVIRNSATSKITFNKLSIITTQSINPTIPMSKFLTWTSVSANQNNFLSNSAYGPGDKSSEIADITPEKIEYRISISSSVNTEAILAYKVDNEEIKEFPYPVFQNYEFPRDFPFTIKFYVKYNLCTDFVELPHKYKEVQSFITVEKVSISNNDIPIECKKTKKTYYINIKNSLSGRFEPELGVTDRDGNLVTLSRGESYKDQFSDYEPFTVDVYAKTFYCQTQTLGTVTAAESETVLTVKDSDIPEICIPYSACYIFDLPSEYTVGYQNIDKEDSEIKEVTSIDLTQNTEFSVKLFLLTSKNCEPNKEWMTVKAKREFTCYKATIDNVPAECKPGEVVKYKVCFDIKNIPSEYKIGYKIDGTDSIKTLTNDPIESTTEFSVKLYIIEGPNCEKNTEINSYKAEKDFQCVALSEADLKDKCPESSSIELPPQTTYYVNIINSLSAGNKLYYQSSNSQYVEITDKYVTSSETSFEVNLYITNSICKTHTFVKKITSTTDDSKTEKIADSNIPESCKETEQSDNYYLCGDFSNLSDNFEFTYTLSFEEGTPSHKLEHGNVSISYNHPFTLTYYMTKSPFCKENEITGKIPASLKFKCMEIDDDDMPEKCISGIQTPDKKDEAFGEISDYTDDKLKEAFNSMQKEDPEDKKIKIVNVGSEKFTFNSELNDNQKIKVNNGAEITYESGNLNLVLDEQKQVNVVLNDKNEANLALYGNGKINLKLSEDNKNNKDVSITINKKSEINDSVTITVPNNVESLIIDSIDLDSEAELKVLNEKKDPITLSVKNVKIIEYSEPTLSNVIIQDSLTIPQSAQVTAEKIEFKDSSIIKYEFQNYHWRRPILSGTFHNLGKVQLKNLKAGEKPQSEYGYPLIMGKFDGITCDQWGKNIDFGNSGLNDFVCLDPDSGKILASEEKNLAVKYNPNNEPKKSGGGTNIGLIVGVVVGVVVVIAIVVVVVIIVIKKKRNNKDSEDEDDNAKVAVDV